MAFCMVSCGGDELYDELDTIPVVDGPGDTVQDCVGPDDVTWSRENTNDPRRTGITV